LLYMDEVFGFFPPVKNPPSKAPMLTLLKQARAFGLGVVLATQNPVDLDYKGLGNTGTWFIGRLQTERDMARVLDGLEGAAAGVQGGFDRQQIERIISGLGNRVFLLNNVHDDGPEIFETRWALSYLRGPLTRTQIKTLMDPYKATLSGLAASAVATKTLASVSQSHPLAHAGAPSTTGGTHPPILPPAIRQYFLPVRGGCPQGARVVYEPRLFASATVHFLDPKKKIDESRELSVLVPITDGAVPLDWDQVTFSDIPADDLDAHPIENATFTDLPAPANQPTYYKAWEKHFADWVFRNQTLKIWKSTSLQTTSQTGESERDFRVRLQQLAHEVRDAETDKLRKKYAPKLTALEDRIRRAQQVVDRETEQATQHKWQTAISFGATVLSAFLGRKAVSGTSMGKATTAIRGLGRSMKEHQDVGRASENVEALTQQLAALETEFKLEAEAVADRWNPHEEALETVTVRPKKSNITLRLVGLSWVPLWMDSQGKRIPWKSR
ncbi:MAG: ATP-binding protein, partial [Nitrospirae bacterium CG_4_9_14_3_um_filter_51_5]